MGVAPNDGSLSRSKADGMQGPILVIESMGLTVWTTDFRLRNGLSGITGTGTATGTDILALGTAGAAADW